MSYDKPARTYSDTYLAKGWTTKAVYRALKRRCPRDLRRGRPLRGARLSTMSQPGREMGQVAAGLLLDEIRDPEHHQHQQVVLKPRLLARRSSELVRSGSTEPSIEAVR